MEDLGGLCPNWSIPTGYWNDGVKEKKNSESVVFDFDVHYSTIPTIHHSNSPKDYAQRQRRLPKNREPPEPKKIDICHAQWYIFLPV
jgi:hypothetical protein